jgi:glycosyltransferase involved in cell wall biosynthesis
MNAQAGAASGNPTITVAICTFNRAASLMRTLASLAEQVSPDELSFDVLVVDNNSTDGTAAAVASFDARLPIRRLGEPRQGLSHARNRALREGRGDVIVFSDDDMQLSPGWLSAYSAAVSGFPQAEYFGGRIVPDWVGPRPAWVREPCIHLVDGLLGWFDRGSNTRLFSADEPTPYGGNFGVRRSLVDRLGMFRTDLGTGGEGSGRGEETEFLIRARADGAVGVYVGEAVSYHSVDPRRLTLKSLYRHGEACGRTNLALSDSGRRGSPWGAGDYLLRGAFQLFRGRGDRFRQCVINAGAEMATWRQR